MIPVHKNTEGQITGLLYHDTKNAFNVDGMLAHKESGKNPSGAYRITVKTSKDDGGCNILITQTGDSATATSGTWLAQGSSEIFVLNEDDIISVIDGYIRQKETVIMDC